MYHEGNRALQDAFGSRALADRLDEKLRRRIKRTLIGPVIVIKQQANFFRRHASLRTMIWINR